MLLLNQYGLEAEFNMNDIIDWLINIEHLAGETYNRTARYFSDDAELKSFLEKIAEDEAWHFHIMGSASENLKKLPISDYAVSIDKETDLKIKGLFHELSEKMDSGSVLRNRGILGCLGKIKFQVDDNNRIQHHLKILNFDSWRRGGKGTNI